MTSTARKTKNRISSFFLPSTKSFDALNTAASPDTFSSQKYKVRKSSAPVLTQMSFHTSGSWPLPEQGAPEPLPTVVEPRNTSDNAPQLLTASPDQELAQLDFGIQSVSLTPQASIQTNAAHHVVPAIITTTAATQRPRSASSSAAARSNTLQPHAAFNSPNNGSIMSNGYGNHSSTDLLNPKKHSLLIKRQKSENTLRHNTAPVNTGNRAVSTGFQPGRVAAPTPPMPPMPTHPTMSVQSMPVPTLHPKKNKSWLFGGNSASRKGGRELTPPAWITGTAEKVPYDLNNLTSGAKVPELWSEKGNVVVHLFPRGSRFGPTFKLDAEFIASSAYLAKLAHGNSNSRVSSRHSSVSQGPISFDPRTQRISANVPGGSSYGTSPNASHTDSSDDSRERDAKFADVDSKEVHLYLPIDLSNPNTPSLSELDIQKLILVRNLFAFLVGQSLIATPKYPTTFQVFVQIANLLLEYGFSNMDASTFGEVANTSFTAYADELGLTDVRESPLKAVEGLILGERMRSSKLWNEAFTHGVGRYSDIQNLALPMVSSLSPIAKQRIERAHMSLEKRLLRIHHQISNFDFPSIFSGIMNSRGAKEREVASFEQWKSGFQRTRGFLINYLKSKHKSWPPKRRRGAGASEPAMSRSVLQGLYSDLAVLYDLMVDRKHPSSRLMIFGRNFPPHMDRRIEALRKVLQEYDQSGSPTYPVMPFDAPRVPRLAPNDDDVTDDPERVSKSDLANLLKRSYNQDTHDEKHPFTQLWMTYEFRSTTGMTIDKIANFRLGSWLFIYCVIQALPMLTVDAPNVIFTEGVEYFLCEPPRGRLHWSKESQQWEWFRDPVTGVVTQLAKDTVDLSDEAMYKLSHCWTKGMIWEREMTDMPGRLRGKSDAQRKATIPQRTGQLPTPPASEHRYSGASSHGQYTVQAAPQHMSLQSLYMSQQDSYSQYGSSQPHTPHQNSPQLLASDYQSGSPVPYSQVPYHSSPEMGASPDPLGYEHLPVMPGIQEEIPQPRARSSSRNPSPHSLYGGLNRRNNRESIFMGGLERLPVPAASSPITREQRAARTASMTFDEILAPMPGQLSNPNSPKIPQERNKSRSRQSSRQVTR